LQWLSRLYEFPARHLAALETKMLLQGKNNALKIPIGNICYPYNLDEFGGINICTDYAVVVF